jgi:hypothetical protein
MYLGGREEGWEEERKRGRGEGGMRDNRGEY